MVVIITATYSEGSPPDSAKWFCKWLSEAATDFRVSKTLLQGMNFAILGLGDSLYKDNFCKVGIF